MNIGNNSPMVPCSFKILCSVIIIDHLGVDQIQHVLIHFRAIQTKVGVESFMFMVFHSKPPASKLSIVNAIDNILQLEISIRLTFEL